MGGTANPRAEEALLWVLNFSDGDYSLADIVRRSGLPEAEILEAGQRLLSHGLLREIDAD
jgi:aminopeptidase-like protein